LSESPAVWCPFYESFIRDGKSPSEACCVCGGGDHQTIMPSSIPSSIPSAIPSVSPYPSVLQSASPSAQCVDYTDYVWDSTLGFGCAELAANFCSNVSDVVVNGRNAAAACCVCGGGM
jgi:hypothetical protein